MRFSGNYLRGRGEGVFFVSLEGYKRQFEQKLKYQPFPGTFNLRLDSEEVKRLEKVLKKKETVVIEGFDDYGSVLCYKAKIEGKKAHLIKPQKNKHPKIIIEFISPFNLKRELGLREGEEVNFKV